MLKRAGWVGENWHIWTSAHTKNNTYFHGYHLNGAHIPKPKNISMK